MRDVRLFALLVSFCAVCFGKPAIGEPRHNAGTPDTQDSVGRNTILYKDVNADQQLIINLNIINDENAATVADGMRVRYNNAYSAAVNSEDIIKIANFSENLASLRENTLLIVEKRPEVMLNDTVFLSVTNTTSGRNYQFEISGMDIPSGITAFLQDNYLGQQSPLNLSGTTLVNFNTSSDPGSYAAGRFNVILANSIPTIRFIGNVFLQGAYDTAHSNMYNLLNTTGILQANASAQPYNNPSFNYTGAESVSSNFFAAHTDIVDWVLLELRNAADPSIVLSRRAAFVKQDGTLCEIDGSNPAITFAGVSAGNYYVSVRHRNHLGIRSPLPVDFSNGTGAYNFTTQSATSFQNKSYTSTVQTGSVWAMRGGNANSNNSVKYSGPDNDQNQILNTRLGGYLSTVLNNVYVPEDLNMDGTVKWNGPGNDQNYLLNSILGGLLSTVYEEQL